MHAELEKEILLFFACAFLGWVLEVSCKAVQFRRFINRGFLIGPYCPIYGCGAVLIGRLLSRFDGRPAVVFALAMAVCGVLEYLTSYAMEKLFHARWWDYSHRRFNLNGRVCANTLIPFGLMGLLLVYGVRPAFFALLDRLPGAWRGGLCAALCGVLLVDAAVSTSVLGKIRHTANLSHGDDTESITRAVREKLLAGGGLVRRTMHAFPHAKLYSDRLLAEMKAQRRRLKAEAKRRKAALRREIDSRERKIRQGVRRFRDGGR